MNQRRLLPALFLLLSASSAFAVDKTWTGITSQDYQTGSNWSPAVVPNTNDRAIIPSTLGPTSKGYPILAANQTQTLDQLVVAPGATLTILDGATVSMDGKKFPLIDGNTTGVLGTGGGSILTPGTGILEINVQGNGIAINQTMTIGSTFVKCNGGGTQCQIQNGVTLTIVGSLQINIGTIQLGVGAQPPTTVQVQDGLVQRGNITITPNGTIAMQANNSLLSLTGDWIVSGKKFNSGNGSTILFNGTGNQSIVITVTHLGDGDFENLAIAGDPTKAPGYRTVTVVNNPSIVNGFEVNGDLTIGPNANLLVLDGCNQAGDQGIGHAATDVFRIDNGATATFRSNCNLSGAISFTDASNNPSTGTIRIENTLTVDGTVMGTSFNAGNGTVEFAGQGVAQIVYGATKGLALAYWNLTIDTTGGAVATQQALPLLVQNTLTIGKTTAGTNTAAIFTAAAGQKITVGKDFVDNATFNAGTSIVVMTSTSGTGRIASDLAAPAALTFNQLLVNHHFIAPAAGPVAPTGALTATQGIAGNVNNGTHSYVVTFVDGAGAESSAGPFSNIVSLAGNRQVQLTAIPTGPAGTSARRIYRTKAGNNGDPQFLSALNDNTTTATTDNTADGGLANVFPPLWASLGGGGAVTAGSHSYVVTFVDNAGFESSAGLSSNVVVVPSPTTQVQLLNIPLGPAGTVARNLYRTVSGNGGTPFYLDQINNNTGTTYNDNLPDTSLADPPPVQAATGIVTAARNFSVTNTFQILEGTLTTSAVMGAPITMSAMIGVLVGDGAGAAGSSQLLLVGPDTLAVANFQTLLVNAVDGALVTRANGGLRIEANNPNLTSVSGRFLTTVNGQLDLWGLNFRNGDVAGINITPSAKVSRLRNVWFRLAGGAGSRFVTFNVPGLDLDCPGCFFDTLAGGFNVQAKGGGMRIRFENRGPAEVSAGGQGIGGPGAGDAFDNDDDSIDNGVLTDAGEPAGGALVQWVYTADIDMIGTIKGAPVPAFDWNTFTYYSTYVVMNQAPGTSDTVYVLDVNGDVKPGYSFSPGVAAGTITGYPFWDTEGGTHVLYFGTTTGLVYKLIDTGAALVPAPAPWNTPFSTGTLKYVSTAIVSDQTNLYFGGNDNLNPAGGTWGLYRVAIATKTMPLVRIPTSSVTSNSAWADTPVGRMLYQGTGNAIYRVKTSNWLVDTQVPSGNVDGPTSMPVDTLFAAEFGGAIHAIPALGTAAQFVDRPGFPFTANGNPVSGGVTWENTWATRLPGLTGGRLFFGTSTGEIFLIYLYPPTWIQGTNYYRIPAPAGSNGVKTLPLVQNGLLYVSTLNGHLNVFDADTGTGPALITSYSLFGQTVTGDISRDSIGSGRIYVGTSSGRVYALTPPPDPTPAVE